MRLLIFTFLCWHTMLTAQTISFSELANMPNRVANNAVTQGTVNGVDYVYSFSGIDSTKACGNTHLLGFRYNTATDEWQSIASLPDASGGKIAAGASTINNKIYIVGGYHVSPNCSETSSLKIHIYDPETNAYLPDGTNLPVSTDDHVQAIYKDSLLYVITGWSNNGNIGNVQIYNPTTDVWQQGTEVPQASADAWKYEAFGASGSIVGDTIYYIGGARDLCNFSACFPPVPFLRKGYINPNDPTDITWMVEETDKAIGYRQAATTFNDRPVWIGGSEITYNFDGIDYNGSGGVPPVPRVTFYDDFDGSLTQIDGAVPAQMDFRGVAKISETEFILAGGMEIGQQVSNKTYKITIGDLGSTQSPTLEPLTLFPNPANDELNIYQAGAYRFEIWSMKGQLLKTGKLFGNQSIEISDLETGIYFVKTQDKGDVLRGSKVIVK